MRGSLLQSRPRQCVRAPSAVRSRPGRLLAVVLAVVLVRLAVVPVLHQGWETWAGQHGLHDVLPGCVRAFGEFG